MAKMATMCNGDTTTAALAAASVNKDTTMATSSPSLNALVQSMLQAAAAAESNKSNGKSENVDGGTAVTVSSTSNSMADGGSLENGSIGTAAEQPSNSGAATSTLSTSRFRGRNAEDRLKRSRERNRVHARKTRQRKKEQMQSLQSKAEQLKKEQVQLKMAINEKNTANILCALFAKDKADAAGEDPRIEALLRRPTDDIPDASKLPALQPLILPSGSAHSKKNAGAATISKEDLPDDGIDYELLGKDRTKCSPAELDRIRRERNRMHAKRTRDRKRHFMEEMTDMCKTLEGENMLLRHHLINLNGGVLPKPEQLQLQQLQQSVTISPSLPPSSPPNAPTAPTGFREIKRAKRSLDTAVAPTAVEQKPAPAKKAAPPTSFGQLDTLLQAAGASIRTHHPYSSGSSSSEDENGAKRRPIAFKRQRKLSASSEEAISHSLVSTAASSIASIGV